MPFFLIAWCAFLSGAPAHSEQVLWIRIIKARQKVHPIYIHLRRCCFILIEQIIDHLLFILPFIYHSTIYYLLLVNSNMCCKVFFFMGKHTDEGICELYLYDIILH